MNGLEPMSNFPMISYVSKHCKYHLESSIDSSLYKCSETSNLYTIADERELTNVIMQGTKACPNSKDVEFNEYQSNLVNLRDLVLAVLTPR